jgi:hypothetical protein
MFESMLTRLKRVAEKRGTARGKSPNTKTPSIKTQPGNFLDKVTGLEKLRAAKSKSLL